MLLDTNIVSFFFRRDTRAGPYERHLLGQPRYIAFVTAAELYQWLFLRPFSEESRQRLLNHIAEHIVVPYDDGLAWKRAELSASCRKSGKTISVPDLWIAATALRHNLPLVTQQSRIFRECVWSGNHHRSSRECLSRSRKLAGQQQISKEEAARKLESANFDCAVVR